MRTFCILLPVVCYLTDDGMTDAKGLHLGPPVVALIVLALVLEILRSRSSLPVGTKTSAGAPPWYVHRAP
jgi:uncharacterized membrane protein (UPF0136 family)